MTNQPYRFDPRALFEALDDSGVEYVVIGGIAATLHGSTLRTGDSDICPSTSPENLERLAEAFRAMGAEIRTERESVPLPVTAGLLGSAEMGNLVTPFGELDVAFRPAGTAGYEDLSVAAVVYDLDGTLVPTASLEDVIRSKAAADREKDRRDLPFLRALLDEVDGSESDRSG